MKNSIKKVLSCILAFTMLFSLVSVAFAAETGQMDETNAGLVTVSATDVALTKSDNAQTVNVSLFVDKNVYLSGLEVQYAGNGVELGEGIPGGGLSGYPTNQGMSVLHSGTYANYDADIDGYVLCTVPVTVPAGGEGPYTVVFSGIEFYDPDNGDGYTISSNTVTATITVVEAPIEGYTVALATNSANNKVIEEQQITVNVAVAHSEDAAFNAGEFKLSYDSALLTPDTAAIAARNLGYKVGTGADGKAELTVEDYGVDKAFTTNGTYVYSIPFTANTVDADTATEVKVTGAAFVNKANAAGSDLIPVANELPVVVEVIIKQNTYTVTLTDTVAGTSTSVTTPAGEDYTFAPTDTANYNYTNVVAKVGENEYTLTNVNNTFTLAGEYVTGNIEITFARNANSYEVAWTGNGAADVANKAYTATYGQNFTFTVPAKVEPQAQAVGYNYSATVTIAGSSYTASGFNGGSVTIPGAEIVGKITIDVTKTEIGANGVAVNIAGADVKFSDGTSSKVVSPGTKLDLVLTPEAGYSYSVKVGDTEIMNDSTTTYQLTVEGATTVVVTKTLAGTVEVKEYVTLNTDIAGNVTMYLVTYKNTLANDKVPTYEGNVMFYSEKYEAYCWLVIAPSLDADTAMSKIGATVATATAVNYSMDINGTRVIDAADAQVVYNMYNTVYTDFSDVERAQFLAADQNGSGDLNTDDAAAIISAILAGTAQ